MTDRLVAALGSALFAVFTAAGYQILIIFLGGGFVFVPIKWWFYFVVALTVLGFVLGPVRIVNIFGYIWGTLEIPQKHQPLILIVVIGVVWAAAYYANT